VGVKRYLFWTVFSLLLLTVTIGGLEFLASLVVPPWPAYELRPLEASAKSGSNIKVFDEQPRYRPTYNSWGMKDRERSLTRPDDVRFRVAFIGDSFTENNFLPSVSEELEKIWTSRGIVGREAINLGVAATSPEQYLFRLRQVGLQLKPDMVVMIFYAGNDFLDERYSPVKSRLSPIAERPLPSLLGAVAPRLDWLIVNRLNLSEIGRNNNSNRPADEMDRLNEIANSGPQRLDRLVDYIGTYYYPALDRAVLREIIGRGGDAFWAPFARRDLDREFLQGWFVAGMVDWETGTWSVPKDLEAARGWVKEDKIEATASWLLAAADDAKAHGVKFVLALAPTGWGDPDYVEYWKPWPRYYSQTIYGEAALQRLAQYLRTKGLEPIELERDLAGARGSYRLTDGHWTSLGTEIVTKRFASELEALIGH